MDSCPWFDLIGFVGEEDHHMGKFTVREHLSRKSAVRGLPREAVDASAQITGISHLLDRRVKRFGQKNALSLLERKLLIIGITAAICRTPF